MPGIELKKIAPFRWQIPLGTVPGMRVPGEIIASTEMIPRIQADRTPQQVSNVATLPGIVGASLAMPDIHWGYGFPIGGVAAFDLKDGVISPGGVGYDINCGVSVVRTALDWHEVRDHIPKLVDALFENIPSGVGSEGRIKLSSRDFDAVLTKGAGWLAETGRASEADLHHMEERGCLDGADPVCVSPRARERAERQLGTLGSGNHFLEIQRVTEIVDSNAADAFGLFKDQIVVMIHSGSRGLGHQVCDESLKVMLGVVRREGIELPDRQLACAPYASKEGQTYLSAMRAAANFAWANRLAMVHLTREIFSRFFKRNRAELKLEMIYDVCHNIAKIEEHRVDGVSRKLCVHRKGATRAFGPGDPTLPAEYRDIGQPVLIPGDMGRASYILVGTGSHSNTFQSSCHGAGRLLSRNAAVAATKGVDVVKQLAGMGVTLRSKEKGTIHEEVPEAYKDVTEVVEAVQGAGLSRIVAKLKPLGVVKG
jgi:tRNA-splicing ligase RtcB